MHWTVTRPHPRSNGMSDALPAVPAASTAAGLGFGPRSWLPAGHPPHIRASPLLRAGGFRVVEGLFDASSLALLLAEALGLLTGAGESRVTAPDVEEVRGGNPPRRFLSSPGSRVQDGFYHAPGMLTFLARVAGAPLGPSGARGTYTFYVRPGDHLALHRDVDSCELAVITCLHDDAPRSTGGGELCLYPGRLFEPLSAIRRDPRAGAVRIRLAPGQTLVMLGGVLPHGVLPVDPGQSRIVSVLCYRAGVKVGVADGNCGCFAGP